MTNRGTSDSASRATIREMARKIVGLEKKVNGLQRPRLTSATSIENASIGSYGGDGALMAILGRQWDGANGISVVNGNPPPTPNTPTLEVVPTGIMATLDGGFLDSEYTV